MTEPTNSVMTSYARQLLLDYLAYETTADAATHLNNIYITEFNERLDAIHTEGASLTEDMIESIHINQSDDTDADAYDMYWAYEEYLYQFVMDRTRPQMVDFVEIVDSTPDISSVYNLIKNASLIHMQAAEAA